jgi:hypothetical protein
MTLTLTLSMILIVAVAKGQQPSPAQIKGDEVASTKNKSEEEPPIAAKIPTATAYLMGVNLGMTANEVREKLGNLKQKGERQDFFEFSDVKRAQVVYDADGKVTTVSFDYVGSNSEAPSPENVLGETVQPRADGSIYHLKRYPEAGYWVAYSRTAGDNPITTVTVQKI